jgi:hypothetical protein
MVKLVEEAFPLFRALKVSTRHVLFFAKAGEDIRDSKGEEILVDLAAKRKDITYFIFEV